ncbi:MAG: hypothetical protein LBJ42_01075, partial [Holosporales bacterium]|nr:hypothetical protein [Holosporales bacterium]
MQITYVQRQIVRLLVGHESHVNFSGTAGFFPFKFSVTGLEVSNSNFDFSIDKLDISMSKGMLHVKNLDAGNVIIKSAEPTKFSLSSMQFMAPLFFQKFIKNASIKSLDCDGIILKKLLLMYDKKTGIRSVAATFRDRKVDCQWSVTGASVIADIGIDDILSNARYNVRTRETNISVDYMNKRITFDGVYDGHDALSGITSLPFKDSKLISKITLKDNFIEAKLRSDKIGASGNVEYEFGTDFMVCNNARLDNGISVMPFVIRNDATISKLTVLTPKGKIYFRNVTLSDDKFSLGDITVSDVDVSCLFGANYRGVLNGICKFENGAEKAKLALTGFRVGEIDIPLINIDATYSSSQVDAAFAFEFLKKKNRIEAKISIKDWMLTDDSPIIMKATGKFNVEDCKFPANQTASGTIVYNLRANGNVGSPILSGDITLKKGHYINSNAGIYLQNIRLDCDVKNNIILIKNIYVSDASKSLGSVSGSGKICMDANKADANILLKVNNLSILDQKWLNAKFIGDLRITGNPYKQCSICGSLGTSIAKVDVSSIVLMASSSVNIVDGSAGNADLSPRLSGISFYQSSDYLNRFVINVDFKSALTVTGLGIDSVWNCNGTVSGNVGNIKYYA